ncbi:MAG: trigger factor [Anaerolineae bacterium]|nr:trigger factor [Anaerolineae bacterium]
MNIQTEHLENHTARLTVEVDPARLEQAMQQAARRISKRGRIPGFRPGKAPMNMVVSLYGHEYVLGEALEKIGNEIYREALEETEIEPYAPGNLEKIEDGGLKLVFIVPLLPTAELGDYRAIRVEFEEPEVTDKMVSDTMDVLRERQALVEEVDRPARMGDQLRLELFEVAYSPDDDLDDVEEDDEEITDTLDEIETGAADLDDEPGEEKTDDDLDDDLDDEEILIHEHGYELVLFDDEDKEVFPGLSAEMVGLSAGDEKEFTLDIPGDYEDEEIAGETLRCMVRVEAVQSRTVPEWTDALVERISDGDFETILELRMDVRKKLEDVAQNVRDSEILDEALDELVEDATIQYPEEMVQEYIDEMLHEFDANLQRQGMTLADLLKITRREEASIREEFRERAVRRVERSLALGELVRLEQLDVSDEDLDGEIDRMSMALGGESQAAQFKQFFNSDESRWNVAGRLATNRAFDRLVAIAKGEDPPLGPIPELEPDEVVTDGAAGAGDAVETAEAVVEDTAAEVEAGGDGDDAE